MNEIFRKKKSKKEEKKKKNRHTLVERRKMYCDLLRLNTSTSCVRVLAGVDPSMRLKQ
jgi:hypothetical protein